MRITILDDYQDAVRGLACFAKLAAHDVRVLNSTLTDPDELVAAIGKAQALVLIRERTRFDRTLLSRLPGVRLLSQTGRVSGHIDLQACTELGIVVCEGVGGSVSTPELTWGLVLAAMRHLPQEVAALRAGRWQTTIGRTLEGKTLGIHGYGRIGAKVASYGQAFGMRVIAWGREGSLTRAREAGIKTATSSAELYGESDVLSLHIQLNGGTRGIVTAADLARMKPDAVFVNTSRAELIEAGALEAALRAGRPGSAAVDVYESEPVLGARHPLLHLDNVICTPHIGYVARESYEAYFASAFDNVLAFASGRPTRVANPEVLS